MSDNDSAGTGGIEVFDAACVSVVIPAYNASALIATTIASVVRQSARPGEIIVVDDGSSDTTADIARSFGVTVISVVNGGPSAARNAGARAATGDYIAFLDSDDLWAPQKLECQLQALRAFGSPAFSFTDYRLFDETGQYPGTELCRYPAFRRSARTIRGSANMLIAAGGKRAALTDSYFPPSAVLVRRSDFWAAGGFDETLRMAEDYEFYLRLLNVVPAVAVMQPLFSYRRHAGQATANAIEGKAGFFAVAERVAAAPGRYPAADALHLARTEHVRCYEMGLAQARLREFDAAVESLRRSLTCRPTIKAALALIGATFARSKTGGIVFDKARSVWKRRPKRRSPAAG